MNSSGLITIGLPVALAIIMFGLGLTLTTGDFRRIAREPKAVMLALVLQIFVLPAVAFGLVTVFGLDPLLAVGVMLLAASPGGTTANLFSHLFRGDVALNITLTAINSVLAVLTIPIITNFAIGHFGADGDVGLQFGKVLQVVAIVLIPVALVSIGALLSERENVAEYARQVGLVTGLFCLASLTFGYATARVLKLGRPQAIATSMEVGIHNTTVALTIALSVLGSAEVAIPAAVYSILMYFLATVFGYAVSRGTSEAPAVDTAPRPPISRKTSP